MKTEDGIREVEPTVGDLFYRRFIDLSAPLQKSISELDIKTFCRNCDSLEENGICRITGSNDQGRYAIRKQCGWVSVGGVRGYMTENGFTSQETVS